MELFSGHEVCINVLLIFERSGWSQRVPDAEIDIGRFKYVLLRLSCPSTGASKLIVRGNRSAGYHADVYEATRDEMSAVGLKAYPSSPPRYEGSTSMLVVV